MVSGDEELWEHRWDCQTGTEITGELIQEDNVTVTNVIIIIMLRMSLLASIGVTDKGRVKLSHDLTN